MSQFLFERLIFNWAAVGRGGGTGGGQDSTRGLPKFIPGGATRRESLSRSVYFLYFHQEMKKLFATNFTGKQTPMSCLLAVQHTGGPRWSNTLVAIKGRVIYIRQY